MSYLNMTKFADEYQDEKFRDVLIQMEKLII